MRKLVLTLLVASGLAASSAAMAATTHTVTGVLKAIDVKACTVSLGKTELFHFQPKCDFSMFKVGEKVQIAYHVSHKQDWATKMVAAKAA